MTQCDRVLEHMQIHGEITSRDAFIDLGVVSLPRRIGDLRERGYNVAARRVKGVNRYGERVYFNVYKLERRAQ